METEAINVQHSGDVVDTIVELKWRDAGLRLLPSRRSATVRASFAYQSKRIVLIYLDYEDSCGKPFANRDRAPEIIGEYNIELERLTHIQGYSGWNSSHLGMDEPDSKIAGLFRRDRVASRASYGKIRSKSDSWAVNNDLRTGPVGQPMACD